MTNRLTRAIGLKEASLGQDLDYIQRSAASLSTETHSNALVNLARHLIDASLKKAEIESLEQERSIQEDSA